MKRQFTRADIKATFLKRWGDEQWNGGYTITLQNIKVVDTEAVPLWLVEYLSSQGQSVFAHVLLLTQQYSKDEDSYHLIALHTKELPILAEGATVEEEDVVLYQQEQEVILALRQKYGLQEES